MRRVGAVVSGLVGLWLAVGAALAFVDAARGTTGDAARSLPLIFGIFGLFLAAGAAVSALLLWNFPRERPEVGANAER
jgi:hypothetical protein